MDLPAKSRTLFIYLWQNEKFISYGSTDGGNLSTSGHDNPSDVNPDSDSSIEFDGDNDYGLYLGKETESYYGEETKSGDANDHSNLSGGATTIDSSVKLK